MLSSILQAATMATVSSTKGVEIECRIKAKERINRYSVMKNRCSSANQPLEAAHIPATKNSTTPTKGRRMDRSELLAGKSSLL